MGKKDDRVYVRGITSADYGLEGERQRMLKAPRVVKGKDQEWEGGPLHWNKTIICPQTVPAQTLYMHVEAMAPGAHSQKHGHQNEAMFYILDGKGYEIHDGKRYEWQAGDAVVVHAGCVHQHFNADPNKPARMLVIKTKPMYNFMNLNEQGLVEPGPQGPPFDPDA
ncbi:MAG: cupin domain-containing protein [Chloroflexi bacterium]|nr:cupin domain-containing protein [Chloroflexota bacterium]